MRIDLDVAITNAHQAGVSARQIADEFAGRVDNMEIAAVMSAPITGQSYSAEHIAAMIDPSLRKKPAEAKKPPAELTGLAAFIRRKQVYRGCLVPSQNSRTCRSLITA